MKYEERDKEHRERNKRAPSLNSRFASALRAACSPGPPTQRGERGKHQKRAARRTDGVEGLTHEEELPRLAERLGKDPVAGSKTTLA